MPASQCIQDFALDLDVNNDMARRPAVPAAPALAAQKVARLKAAFRDAEAFKALFSDLSGDKTLSVADVIEIARQFGAGSTKSRKAALQAIASQRKRRRHTFAKSDIAACSRNW